MTPDTPSPMSAKSKVMYLLTIEGVPAFFDGQQIVYMRDNGRGSVRESCRLCTKEEVDDAIRDTEKFRLRKGFDFDPEIYDALRVRVPA